MFAFCVLGVPLALTIGIWQLSRCLDDLPLDRVPDLTTANGSNALRGHQLSWGPLDDLQVRCLLAQAPPRR